MNTKTHAEMPLHDLPSKDEIMSDLRSVLEVVEELLNATSDQAGEGAAAVNASIQQNLRDAKERLETVGKAVIERSKRTAKITDQYVHDNPWKSIGISACVGVIIGILITRR